MKYTITQEDEFIVSDFIERSLNQHIHKNRSEYQVREDLRIGKLGEIAYKHWHGDSISGIDWSGIPQGTSPDFRDNEGKGIQIKTMRSDTKWCSFYNWNFDQLVALRIVGNEIHLVSELSIYSLKTIAKSSKWSGWYFYP